MRNVFRLMKILTVKYIVSEDIVSICTCYLTVAVFQYSCISDGNVAICQGISDMSGRFKNKVFRTFERTYKHLPLLIIDTDTHSFQPYS